MTLQFYITLWDYNSLDCLSLLGYRIPSYILNGDKFPYVGLVLYTRKFSLREGKKLLMRCPPTQKECSSQRMGTYGQIEKRDIGINAAVYKAA